MDLEGPTLAAAGIFGREQVAAGVGGEPDEGVAASELAPGATTIGAPFLPVVAVRGGAERRERDLVARLWAIHTPRAMACDTDEETIPRDFDD